jgi:NAD(P)H-flavin reductase
VSIASAVTDGDNPRFTIMQLGKVTSALHQLDVGQHLGLRGPYGNGFPVDRWAGHDLVLVGGGCGQAPLHSLLHTLLYRREDYGRIQVFYGARTPEDMVYKEEYAALEASDVVDLYRAIDPKRGPDGLIDEDARPGWKRVCFDDPGSSQIAPDQKRFTGYVPHVVEAVAPSPDNTIAITCGPPVMIHKVLDALARLGFESDQIFTTLERRMKCGIGRCGRCNLGGTFVCTDGPVFSLAQLEQLPEAFS